LLYSSNSGKGKGGAAILALDYSLGPHHHKGGEKRKNNFEKRRIESGGLS